MKNKSSCDNFQDLLDKSETGTLTRAENDLLQSHADSCEDCAMLMKIHEHLAAHPVDGIAEHITETMIPELWNRIDDNLPPAGQIRTPGFVSRIRRSLLAPALSVTAIFLILMNIFLFTELQKLRTRENDLVQMLSQQTKLFEEIRDYRMQAGTAHRAEYAFNKNRLRLLSGQNALSVAELRSLLESVPPDLQILTQSYIGHLFSQLSSWEKTRWEKALEVIETSDGIQSREAIALLDALHLDPDDTVTPARLAALANL